MGDNQKDRELRKLGAEVETQFVYRPQETSMATAEAAVRADQEAVCGYKLVLLKQRHLELADAKGPYVEVFVTYGPYPEYVETALQPAPAAPEPQPIDGTQISPA